MIHGDPTKKTPPNTCHFCYLKFKNKYNLKKHFKTCKIKNGGMEILFKTINELKSDNVALKQEVKQLKTETKGMMVQNINNTKNTINNNTNNNTFNHFDVTNNNLNLVGFGSAEEYDTIKTILLANASRILGKAITNTPRDEQRKDRVYEMVTTVYRNPEYPQMQNIYVTNAMKKTNNAFKYYNNGWQSCDWSQLNTAMLGKLWNVLMDNRSKMGKDTLRVIACLPELTGKVNIETLTRAMVKEIHQEMGRRLSSDSIYIPKTPETDAIESTASPDAIEA
jgi:hypothetical protein